MIMKIKKKINQYPNTKMKFMHTKKSTKKWMINTNKFCNKIKN